MEFSIRDEVLIPFNGNSISLKMGMISAYSNHEWELLYFTSRIKCCTHEDENPKESMNGRLALGHPLVVILWMKILTNQTFVTCLHAQ